jgi:hypothetical protein
MAKVAFSLFRDAGGPPFLRTPPIKVLILAMPIQDSLKRDISSAVLPRAQRGNDVQQVAAGLGMIIASLSLSLSRAP